MKGRSKVKAEFKREFSHAVARPETAAASSAAAPAASEAPPAEADPGTGKRGRDDKRDKRDKKSRKKRTQRGRVQRQSWDTLCANVAKGDACSYGDTCKFSHDVAQFLAAKPPVLVQGKAVQTCAVYDKLGVCPSGIRCLFGASHIEVSADGGAVSVDTRTDAVKAELAAAKCDAAGESNYLRPETKQALRKKKYFATGFAMDPEPRKKPDFHHKVYVAPLTTVGNLPFRRVVKDFGADITCGEMALVKNIMDGSPHEWALLRRHKCEDVFGVQIAGGFADSTAEAVALIERETDVDFVDLNLGCPIDLVTDRGMGSALLNRVGKLDSIVSAILNKTNGRMPLGLKVRTGWTKGKPTTEHLTSLVQTWRHRPHGGSLCYLSIHGRSRMARYTSTANWDFVHRCSGRAVATELIFRSTHASSASSAVDPIPVFGNGDIMSYVDWETHLERVQLWKEQIEQVTSDCGNADSRLFKELFASGGAGRDHAIDMDLADAFAEQTRLTTCMVARGALIKPWIATEIKERRHWDISGSERMDILRRFVDYGLEHWGSDWLGVQTVRRFLLEHLSFGHRYVPVGILDAAYVPQHVNDRPDVYVGRDDRETLLSSSQASDWVKLTEMFLGPAPEGFVFEPKHQSNSYGRTAEDLAYAI